MTNPAASSSRTPPKKKSDETDNQSAALIAAFATSKPNNVRDLAAYVANFSKAMQKQYEEIHKKV